MVAHPHPNFFPPLMPSQPSLFVYGFDAFDRSLNLISITCHSICLLYSKSPSGFLRALDDVEHPALVLRVLTVLVNLHTVSDTFTRGDVDDLLAASGEEFAVRHDGYVGRLRCKLVQLSRHTDQDIRLNALRLISLLPSV